MASEDTGIYGLMAEFEDPDALLAATRRASAEGYRKVEAYSPFPVEGLSEAAGMKRNWLPWVILVFGLMGGLGAFGMMWYATVISYPLNAGGKDLFSWPAYVPITFELTVLSAGFAALFGMIIMNGLPQPYHPVWNVPEFIRASRDRFFLVVESGDPKFDLQATTNFLNGLHGVKDVAQVTP